MNQFPNNVHQKLKCQNFVFEEGHLTPGQGVILNRFLVLWGGDLNKPISKSLNAEEEGVGDEVWN